jgi:cytochrome c oxidase subunit 4
MSNAHAHPHANDAHDVQKHIRGYLIIGAALMVGTILTVWASFINFGSPTANIVVALIIASVKSFLVAGYFMHLISEKKMIYSVLICTVFFFVALMFLTIWSMAPESIIQMQH